MVICFSAFSYFNKHSSVKLCIHWNSIRFSCKQILQKLQNMPCKLTQQSVTVPFKTHRSQYTSFSPVKMNMKLNNENNTVVSLIHCRVATRGGTIFLRTTALFNTHPTTEKGVKCCVRPRCTRIVKENRVPGFGILTL